jgi:DeoR family transcriptional regulator, aga operon transcriptional repressor
VRVRRADRLTALLEMLAASGSMDVAGAAHELGVSTTTIRRDLQLLSEQRLLNRTHGGAVAHGVLYELPLRYRSGGQQEVKRRIGTAAAKRVGDREVVGLTGGTTTTEVARAMVDRRQLTVVTNSLNIGAELAVRPNLKLVMTGGVARSESYELVGPLADASLARLHLDLAFVGADGISPDDGLTTHHEIEAHTNRVLIDRAARVVVVADSSKLGRIAFARICGLDQVDELVTDLDADPDAIATIERAGVEVTLV